MNNLEFLTPSEKIAALIDGELKINEVGNIFFDISQNSELQEEFIDQIALKNMFNEPVMTPPSGLKTAILAGAGIGSGAVVSVQPNQIMSVVHTIATSRVFLLTISAVLSSLITYLLLVNPGDSNANFASKNGVYNSSNQNAPQENNSYPIVSADLSQNQSQAKSDKPKVITIIKYVPVVETNEKDILDGSESQLLVSNLENDKINEEQEQQPIAVANIETSKIESVDLDFPLTTENENSLAVALSKTQSREKSNNEIVPISRLKVKANTEDESQLSINFRGFSNSSFQKIDLPPANEPAINNIGIGLMYHLDQNLEVGVEFGQENFIQQYKAVSGNKEYLLKQNYLTFWGGAKAKIIGESSIVVNDLHPFSSLLVGMTNVGPLGKLELGLTYRVTDKFALYGAGELTSMFSSYNKQWTSTHKYGMSYGMMIKF